MPGSMAWPPRPAASLSSPIARTLPSSSVAAWWSPPASTRSSISPSPSPDRTPSSLRKGRRSSRAGHGKARAEFNEGPRPRRILLFVDLFDPPVSSTPAPPAPLADRMRPKSLDEVVGQHHLIGPGKVLRRSLQDGRLHSMILWGPPGTGKTTLASLMAQVAGARFVPFSAVMAGVKEIRQVVSEAEADRSRGGRRTILFVDEIHRFNKSQQDAFLPHVEKGTLILIGATTENPSFEVNAALLSRCRVYSLHPLSEDDVVNILERALHDAERGLGGSCAAAEPDALRLIARLSDGDARGALNILELAVTLHGGAVTETAIREAVQKKALLYDKSGEEHYNLISALHKSLRDSDPDGALYWLGRMLEAGEDVLYVARRLV